MQVLWACESLESFLRDWSLLGNVCQHLDHAQELLQVCLFSQFIIKICSFLLDLDVYL